MKYVDLIKEISYVTDNFIYNYACVKEIFPQVKIVCCGECDKCWNTEIGDDEL